MCADREKTKNKMVDSNSIASSIWENKESVFMCVLKVKKYTTKLLKAENSKDFNLEVK